MDIFTPDISQSPILTLPVIPKARLAQVGLMHPRPGTSITVSGAFEVIDRRVYL
jgi:hypothetical protein